MSKMQYVVVRERKLDGDLMTIGPYDSVQQARDHAQQVDNRVRGLMPHECKDLQWSDNGREYDGGTYRLRIVWLYSPVLPEQ